MPPPFTPHVPGEPEFRPGEPVSLEEMARVVAYALEQSRADGFGGGAADVDGPFAGYASPGFRFGFFARVTNRSVPYYSFKEVFPTNGIWGDRDGGYTGLLNAREFNDNPDVPYGADDGAVVWMWLATEEDEDGVLYRFCHPSTSPPQTTDCLTWFTGHDHVRGVLVEVGQELTQGQQIAEIGFHPNGAHLHFSVGDGQDLLTPSTDISVQSFVGQTVDTSAWFGVPQVNVRTAGVPGPNASLFSAADVAAIRAHSRFPLDASLSWVDLLGSVMHGGYEYYACDYNLTPWNDPAYSNADLGQPVYNPAVGEGVATTVHHVQDLGEVGWIVVLCHTLNCGSGSGSGSGCGSGDYDWRETGDHGPPEGGGADVYETDVRCEAGLLKVYRRVVSLAIELGRLVRSTGAWLLWSVEGCCECGSGSGAGVGACCDPMPDYVCLTLESEDERLYSSDGCPQFLGDFTLALQEDDTYLGPDITCGSNTARYVASCSDGVLSLSLEYDGAWPTPFTFSGVSTSFTCTPEFSASGDVFWEFSPEAGDFGDGNDPDSMCCAYGYGVAGTTVTGTFSMVEGSCSGSGSGSGSSGTVDTLCCPDGGVCQDLVVTFEGGPACLDGVEVPLAWSAGNQKWEGTFGPECSMVGTNGLVLECLGGGTWSLTLVTSGCILTSPGNPDTAVCDPFELRFEGVALDADCDGGTATLVVRPAATCDGGGSGSGSGGVAPGVEVGCCEGVEVCSELEVRFSNSSFANTNNCLEDRTAHLVWDADLELWQGDYGPFCTMIDRDTLQLRCLTIDGVSSWFFNSGAGFCIMPPSTPTSTVCDPFEMTFTGVEVTPFCGGPGGTVDLTITPHRNCTEANDGVSFSTCCPGDSIPRTLYLSVSGPGVSECMYDSVELTYRDSHVSAAFVNTWSGYGGACNERAVSWRLGCSESGWTLELLCNEVATGGDVVVISSEACVPFGMTGTFTPSVTGGYVDNPCLFNNSGVITWTITE